MEIAEGQIKNRAGEAYGVLENLLELGKQEHSKGEIAGINLFQVMPHKRIEDIQTTIDQINEELEDDDTSSSTESGSVGFAGNAPEPGDSRGDST